MPRRTKSLLSWDRRTKPAHYRTGAWNGTITTSGVARWLVLMGRWAAPPRSNARNTSSDSIMSASCAHGINIWNRPANPAPDEAHIMIRSRAGKDMCHG